MPTDYFCIGKSDIRDSKTVDYFCKCCFFCLLNAVHQIFIGLFSKAFHRYDLITKLFYLKDISEVVYKTFCNKFFQRCLWQSVNIHGISAYKQSKCLDLFCRTVRIHTVKCLYIIFPDHFGFLTARRTDFRYFQITTSCQILSNLWNDHICFIYLNRIPNSQLQIFHDTHIMHAGTADCRSLQFDRIKYGNRINETCPWRTPFNFTKCRLPHFIGPFKSKRIPGKFRSTSEWFSIGNIII